MKMLATITFLLHCLLISVVFGKDVCFTNIQLVDSYTKTQNCTDPAHYFLIESQLSIGKGSYEDDVYLTVPSQFDSFPTLPLNISNNGQLIASIYEKGNNVVGISFPSSFSQDTAINFNILAKLSDSTVDSIQSGENITFSFATTTDSLFNSTINFLQKASDSLATNGGYFSNNNTAWFTADIPISLLNKAITFKSVTTGTNNYTYNVNATKLEVITSVDSQGNPLNKVPFTAYSDKSTDDQIEISIDTMISGSAKFVRIYYYTDKLDKTPISYSATLVQSNSLMKRDLTDSVTGTIYGVNSDTENNDIVVMSTVSATSTSATPTSMSTAYISTPLYLNNTYTSTSSYVTSTFYTTSTISESTLSDISMELSSGLITTAKKNSSSIITSVSPTFNSSSSFSSSSSSSSFSFSPSPSSFSFTNTTSLSNTTSVPSLTTSDNVVLTYKVYTLTNSAVVTEIGSYVAISTIKPTETSTSTIVSGIALSTNGISNSTAQLSTVSHEIFSTSSSATSSISTVQTFTSNYLNATSAASGISSVVITTSTSAEAITKPTANVTETTTTKNHSITIATADVTIDSTNKHTNSVLSNSTSNAHSDDLYTTIINGVAVTKTLSGIYSVETDLIPISTLSNGNVINIYQTEISGSVVTKTMTAINSVYTELVAITRIYNLTTTISCSTETSFTVITKTQNGLETVATDISAIATLHNKTTVLSSTATHTGKIVSTTTLSPVNSVYSSMVPFTTLSTETEQQSSTIVSATLDALTRSTSTLKATATIKSSSSSSDTKQSRSTSVTISSIQSELSQYSNSAHTTISVVPYEAGSNQLASSVSYFFITLLALLF